MPESRSHKTGKGSAKRQEVPIPGNRRLDALRGTSAIEVEREAHLSLLIRRCHD
jgi:hypothetical protein